VPNPRRSDESEQHKRKCGTAFAGFAGAKSYPRSSAVGLGEAKTTAAADWGAIAI